MKPEKILSKNTTCQIALIIIIVSRLILNAVVPLMDKTEARYGEIARIMAETGNWVTPQADYGFPFWAKPPLSTWLSAISIKIFGANEFAVRFPSFAIALLLLVLLKPYAKRWNLPLAVPAFLLFSIPEFMLHMGVVSTDMALLLSMTLVMVSFWETVSGQSKYWKYLFFAGVGLGFLAKGPIVLLLAGPPLFIWAVRFRMFPRILRSFPWVSGILIVLVIALPWYCLAERRTPGFLEYFFVGEHFKRFFDASWKGDKYGFPKTQPLGIIWVFLYSLALPWILFVTFKLAKTWRRILSDRWLLFLILWIFWTPFFFTFSKSLIHTYILPCTFPIALFVAFFWRNIQHKKAYFLGAMLVPLLSIALIVLKLVPGVYEKNSNTDKYILSQHTDLPLYYAGEKTYSSQFYSRGKVRAVDVSDIPSLSGSYDLIVPKKDSLPQAGDLGLKKIAEGRKAVLYRRQSR